MKEIYILLNQLNNIKENLFYLNELDDLDKIMLMLPKIKRLIINMKILQATSQVIKIDI
jgi:hypothetical protein